MTSSVQVLLILLLALGVPALFALHEWGGRRQGGFKGKGRRGRNGDPPEPPRPPVLGDDDGSSKRPLPLCLVQVTARGVPMREPARPQAVLEPAARQREPELV